MNAEALRSRTKDFALQAIQTVELLPKTTTTNVLGKQLIRSATSVGANYRAACRARSRAEFIAKMHIVLEEADESQYWIELLQVLNTARSTNLVVLLKEASELAAIFTSSMRTLRSTKLQEQKH